MRDQQGAERDAQQQQAEIEGAAPGGGFGDDWLNWSPYTYPFNLTGQPAASVPCGLAGNGLPIGAQLVGRLGEDALVLRASRAIEQAGLLVSLNYLDNIKS